MATFRQIRNAVFVELQQQLPGCRVVKYDRESPSIEICPNPERVILIDFDKDEVEVYDGSPATEAAEQVYRLEITSPSFLDRLWTIIKMGVRLSPEDNR